MLVRRLEELWNGWVEMDVIRNACRSSLLLQAILWSILLLHLIIGSSQSEILFYLLWGVYPAFVVVLFFSIKAFFSFMVLGLSFLIMMLSFSFFSYANDFLFVMSFFGLAVFFWLLMRSSIGPGIYFFSFIFLPFFGVLLMHRHVLAVGCVRKANAREKL